LSCKNRLPYNLYCVGGDVKHCTVQSNPVVDLLLLVQNDNVKLFNTFLPELKSTLTIKGRSNYWQEIVDGNISTRTSAFCLILVCKAYDTSESFLGDVV